MYFNRVRASLKEITKPKDAMNMRKQSDEAETVIRAALASHVYGCELSES